MDLYYIDHISTSGRSWLHRTPVGVKTAFLAVLIGSLLWLRDIPVTAGILAAVLAVAASARLPMKLVLALMLYPLLFLVLLFFSLSELSWLGILLVILRVVTITASVVVYLLTTSYPAIFGALGRVLPDYLIAALFFTYRSIFIISDSINDIRTALHLRGGIDWKHPRDALQHLGVALGHFLVHSIETSQRMADSLRVRGFANKIYYLGNRVE